MARPEDSVEARDQGSIYEWFFNRSPDLLGIVNTKGYLTQTNPAWQRALGWTPEELNTTSLHGLIHADDLEASRTAIQQLLIGQPDVDLEVRFRCKDGSYRWLQLRAAPLDTGQFCCVAREIAGRDGATSPVQGHMDAVVEAVLAGIITIDTRGTITSFNPAMEEIFGYTASEVIGSNLSVLMPEPYRSKHDSYLQRYLETGAARILGTELEVSGQRKDGSTFPMTLAISEMQVAGRRMFAGVIRELTEKEEAQGSPQRAE